LTDESCENCKYFENADNSIFACGNQKMQDLKLAGDKIYILEDFMACGNWEPKSKAGGLEG